VSKRRFKVTAITKRCVDCGAPMAAWSSFTRCYECWVSAIVDGTIEKEHES
jgi:hypothetical protein